MLANPRQAVVICTRNRPADLKRTLGSIADQRAGEALRTLVVDASDEATRRRNEALVAAQPAARHLPFPFAPSLPQQRNYGLDHLPDDTDVVHFVDDDVAGQEGYFRHLTRALRACPEAQGAGGLFTEPSAGAEDRAASLRRVTRRLFLLASSTPGRVLPSGHAAPAQRAPSRARRTQWLTGCSMSFRRAALEAYRFDADAPPTRLTTTWTFPTAWGTRGCSWSCPKPVSCTTAPPRIATMPGASAASRWWPATGSLRKTFATRYASPPSGGAWPGASWRCSPPATGAHLRGQTQVGRAARPPGRHPRRLAARPPAAANPMTFA